MGYLCIIALALCVIIARSSESTSVKVNNQAGSPIDIWWINPESSIMEDGLVKQNPKPIRNNVSVVMSTFEHHQFYIRFAKHIDGTDTLFTKGPKDESIIIYFDDDAEELKYKNAVKRDNLMQTIKDTVDQCLDYQHTELNFTSCVTAGVADDVVRLTDSNLHMRKYRDVISSRLRNYTCADEKMETSPTIDSYQLELQGNTYTVESLFHDDHAKIWKIDGFVTDQECQRLMDYGRPLLRRATVAAEDGTSVVSENRKANQAGYDLDKEKPEEDPLWSLYNRVFEATNHHTGFSLETPGQEDFTIIQYNVADQYTPHCDGSCNHEPHHDKGRVATAVLYCQVAERGGATTFTKSDIFVKPKVGSVTFFSYKGPDGRMDNGLTEHSGCPVMEGEKWIATVWMREGVSKEAPWSLFDPSGIPILD